MNPFGEEHHILRQEVRRFAEKELLPHASEWEQAKHFPRWVFEKMGELGLLGVRFPEKYGGSGGDIWHTVAMVEELTRCTMAGLTMSILVQTDMATPIICAIGSEEQKSEFLEPAIKGTKIAALAVTEPDAGSDVAGIRTWARRDGDDYIINGSKTYITNGTRADFLTLAVRTDKSDRYGGISLFTFPTDTPGFIVSRKLEKLGNHTSDTAELFFEDCRIPARYILGREGLGFQYVMNNFQDERLVAAISCIATAQHILEETIEYCRERKAFGRPLMGFQVSRHNIVQMATELEAGRQLAYHAADLFNRKGKAVREISMAKLFCSETATRVVDRCLQLYGGIGYMEELPIARAFRDMRLLTIGAGTSEIMRELLSKVMGL